MSSRTVRPLPAPHRLGLRRTALRRAVRALVVGVFAACHPHHGGQPSVEPSEGRLITAQEIARCNATDAWDLLTKVGVPLTFREGIHGEPLRLRSRRGSQRDTPVVVLDGARLGDFRVLRDIPASAILRVRILSAIDGTTYLGTNASGGVILISTRVEEEDE